MNDHVQIDIQSEFSGYHGGISAWLVTLADDLVEHGADHVLQSIENKLVDAEDLKSKNDVHFLRAGIRSINATDLENLLVPLRELYSRISEANRNWDQYSDEIAQAERKWRLVAERAKQEFLNWQTWAYDAEIARRKTIPFFKPTNGMGFQIKFGGGTIALESPQKYLENRLAFEKKVKAIRTLIANAYIADELPPNLAVSDFDTAILSVSEHQSRVDALSEILRQAKDEADALAKNYDSLRAPLLRLLWTMPETARWALFRIQRPELSRSVTA